MTKFVSCKGFRMRRRLPLLALVVATIGSSAPAAQRGAVNREWPTYGGDVGGTKYSPLDQIDRRNVKRLRVVWRWESPDNAVLSTHRREIPMLPAAFKATPIMVNGILYIKTSLSEAAAIDAATGDRKSTRLNSSHIQKSRMPSSA